MVKIKRNHVELVLCQSVMEKSGYYWVVIQESRLGIPTTEIYDDQKDAERKIPIKQTKKDATIYKIN